MIRVLIVDDSPTIRLLLRKILQSDPEIEVIGEARNGEDAVISNSKLKPDIITMDINMPGMDGYEAIRQIMQNAPCPILVLTGIESQHLIEVSFTALQCGALNVLPKPTNIVQQPAEAAQLITQIKTLAAIKVIHWSFPGKSNDVISDKKSHPVIKKTTPIPLNIPTGGVRTYQVVAIGTSTGGPPALQSLLCALPPSFPLPIVIVQHITRGFVYSLADWLSKTTPFKCSVAVLGETIQPGQVYLAPDDFHLMIQSSGQFYLSNAEPIGNLRPSVNALFESVAASFGASAIGVILTGMGKDGASGLSAMRRAGAYTIAQDETTSTIFGMPKEAIDLGAALEILPLDQIALKMVTLTKS